MPDLPAGAFTVSVTREGFQPKAVEVVLAAAHQLQLDVALAGVPGTVAGVATA